MRKIKNIRLGQKIEQKVMIYDNNDYHRATSKMLKWIVTAVFPFFVKVRRYDENGCVVNGTFCLGELVQLGYEPKGGGL